MKKVDLSSVGAISPRFSTSLDERWAEDGIPLHKIRALVMSP